MIKPPEFCVFKVSDRPSRGLTEGGRPDYRYSTGYVGTPDGVVGVYMQDGHTSLLLVRDGQEYRGWWHRRFRERALITLCKRFAADPSGAWA